MEQLKNFLSNNINKYKYVILIIAIGVVLVLLPEKKDIKDSKEVNIQQNIISTQSESLECRIEEILACIHGAGKVDVLLSVAEGEEIYYQSNEDTQLSDNGESYRTDTVITVDAQRNETGLVRQINPPQYLGAVIVCQGADDPNVRLAIVDAVTKATGLRADKISVLKMK